MKNKKRALQTLRTEKGILIVNQVNGAIVKEIKPPEKRSGRGRIEKMFPFETTQIFNSKYK